MGWHIEVGEVWIMAIFRPQYQAEVPPIFRRVSGEFYVCMHSVAQKRWVLEPSFAWLDKCQRLEKLRTKLETSLHFTGWFFFAIIVALMLIFSKKNRTKRMTCRPPA
jgi:hypothetical protein